MYCLDDIIYILLFFTAIIGASIGSFLNVIIYRLPLKQSIAFPASHCPKCKTPIKFYHNIPILSYLFLKGKCKKCNNKIPVRYLIVEILTMLGFISILVLNNFSFDVVLLRNLIFFCTGIVIVFIDFNHFIIPDVITLPMIFIGLLISWFNNQFIDSLIGAASGFLIFYAISIVYYALKKQEGLGGGDVKYIAGIGAMLGVKGTVFVMFFSSVIALLSYSVFMSYLNKHKTISESNLSNSEKIIPYGIFLAASGILFIIFGEPVSNWYLSFIYR